MTRSARDIRIEDAARTLLYAIAAHEAFGDTLTAAARALDAALAAPEPAPPNLAALPDTTARDRALLTESRRIRFWKRDATFEEQDAETLSCVNRDHPPPDLAALLAAERERIAQRFDVLRDDIDDVSEVGVWAARFVRALGPETAEEREVCLDAPDGKVCRCCRLRAAEKARVSR